MTTDKYDLHTADYSVQGWDTIMSTDMEQLDDVIQSRIDGTGGEAIDQYEAVYYKSDGKYWLAQANGTLQPCRGLAVEGAAADASFRIQRIGVITNVAWSWATIGANVYLDTATPGAITDVKPTSDNRQIIGFVLSATSIFILIESDEGATVTGSSGGLSRKVAEGTAAITASASVTLTLSIPTNCRLLAAQFRVDVALAGGELWDAAYETGSTTALVSGAAVAQNTKVDKMHVDEITSASTDIAITKNGGGSFTAQGTIRAIVFYEELTAMADV